MKKTLSIITLIFISVISYGQIRTDGSVKKIEVTGKAEMEVIPDEIHLRITMKEYKQGSKTVDINTLEENLVKTVRKLKLDDDALRVDNVYGYNWNWKKKKPDEFLASKSFKLKVNNVKMVNDLIAEIDSEGLSNLAVASISHTKIEEHKMNLKIEALKNAKNKATQLLAAIDEELGSALEIQELDYGNNQVYGRNDIMMSAKRESGSYQSNLDFKNITIKAQVRTVFEIK